MQVDLERVKYAVREAARLQPGRPALRMGLRAALAVAAPLLVASQIGAVVTAWATIGGFGVVLVDKSGAYRTRAIAMLAATLGGTLGVLAGTLAAKSAATLAIVTIGTGMCAMSWTWTGPAVAVGNTIAMQLIVASTLPHDPAKPWVPALGFLAGAGWSVVLALFLWPIRIYRPARVAAAHCLEVVARQAAAIAARDADPAAWQAAAIRQHRTNRETLEAARAVLAATRRGRRGEIGRGERLLVIIESVDQVFGMLIAVEEVIDNLSSEAGTAVAEELRTGLTAAAERLDAIADRVVVEAVLPPLPPIAWTPDLDAVAALPALPRVEVEHALSLVVRIHEDTAAIAALVDSLNDEHEPALVAPRPEVSGLLRIDKLAATAGSVAATAGSVANAAAATPQQRATTMTGAIRRMPGATARLTGVEGVSGASGAIARVTSNMLDDVSPPVNAPAPPGWIDALRGSLALDSAVLRHATRIAVVALLSVIATRTLELERGYWATLTAILLLQPYLPATLTRGIQRVAGTILGGILATLIGAVVHDPVGIGIVVIVLAGVCAAVIQLNYGLYALFLTPTFVLLAEVHAPDAHLVALRISNTLLGAGLAVFGALVLWPIRESTRTHDRLADAIDATAGHAHEVFAAVARRAPARSSSVITARRRAGRALNNADLSLDRMAAEGPPPVVLETHMAVATMTRRFSSSLSAFATARHIGGEPLPSPASATTLAAIGSDVENYLRDAANALRSGTPPPSYQRHDAAAASLPPLIGAKVARIDRQLAILSEAVARTVGAQPGEAVSAIRPAIRA